MQYNNYGLTVEMLKDGSLAAFQGLVEAMQDDEFLAMIHMSIDRQHLPITIEVGQFQFTIDSAEDLQSLLDELGLGTKQLA